MAENDGTEAIKRELEKLRGEEESEKTGEAPAAAVKGSDIALIMKTKADLEIEQKVEIKIPSTETQREDVFVGINGYVFQIQRDKWVKVPKSVVTQLANMTTTTYRQQKREAPEEGNELIAIESQRFPFQTRY